MWKDTVKKKIFDETPEEMTDFMNVTPRMKAEATKRKTRERDEGELLIGMTKELLERIESKLDSLSVKELEDLYDALDDAINMID